MDSDWRSKAHAAFAANQDVCISRAEDPIVVNIDLNTIASWTTLPVAEAETKEWGVQSITFIQLSIKHSSDSVFSQVSNSGLFHGRGNPPFTAVLQTKMDSLTSANCQMRTRK
jgi:hypothetical protein